LGAHHSLSPMMKLGIHDLKKNTLALSCDGHVQTKVEVGYILMLGTYTEFAREDRNLHGKLLALSVCFSAAISACLPRQDHVWITTDHFVCVLKNELDGMPYKLDFTENLRLFKKYPTLLQGESVLTVPVHPPVV